MSLCAWWIMMFVIKRMTMIMTTMTMMTVNILRPVNLVGQPARCLYVAEARSSVLSVTVCALEEHPYTIPTYQDWEVSGNIFVKKEYISSMLSVTPCAFPEKHLSNIPQCIPTDFQSTRIEFFIFHFRYAPLFYSRSHIFTVHWWKVALRKMWFQISTYLNWGLITMVA